MKNILNRLPILAFVLTAIAAFAFTQPRAIQTGFGAERDAQGNIVAWHDISQLDPEDYRCNESELDCIYEEDDESSAVLEEGTFELLNP